MRMSRRGGPPPAGRRLKNVSWYGALASTQVTSALHSSGASFTSLRCNSSPSSTVTSRLSCEPNCLGRVTAAPSNRLETETSAGPGLSVPLRSPNSVRYER